MFSFDDTKIQPEFKVKFDILDYKKQGILPDIKEYLKHDVIINYEEYEKGNLHNCFWQKQPEPIILTADYIEREVSRIIRTGVWVCIKHEIVWIPPMYYFFLQYFTVIGSAPQFRLKRLKHVYFKLGVRANTFAIGTYTIKNRQDGETTTAMGDSLWEIADGNMDYGSIGMQSKTRDTVVKSCWRTIIMGWNTIPKWLKDAIYSDFISGDKIAEAMKFRREINGDDLGRDILITFGPSVHNAFDSMSNMRRCILDEVNKWMECSFYDTFLNYKKFIAAGTSRKGLFDIFSSPADKDGKWNDEAYEFWKLSDTSKLDANGTTANRVHRYYSDPLDGIEGMYDKFGDADPVAIRDFIMSERKNVPKDKLMGEIRGYPLDEEEMFGSFEGGQLWDNQKGLISRKTFLIGRSFKDEVTKEPTVVYGNLEREDGYIDGEVFFKLSNKTSFDLREARWCFSYLPQHKAPLKSIFKPPKYIENCLGIDPANNRYEAKNRVSQSNFAMVNRKFRDIFDTGIVKCPTMIYLNRPVPLDIAFEDAIKTAIFNRALVQYENKNDKLANHFEDRGYFDWLLPSIGEDKDSVRKGDAPTGNSKSRGKFIDEGIGLVNAVTTDELLRLEWFYQLIEDRLKFNPLDTHENDLTMADFQSLLGIVKILYQKVRRKSNVGNAVLEFLSS